MIYHIYLQHDAEGHDAERFTTKDVTLGEAIEEANRLLWDRQAYGVAVIGPRVFVPRTEYANLRTGDNPPDDVRHAAIAPAALPMAGNPVLEERLIREGMEIASA